MTTNIKYTLQTCIKLDNLKLDGFKIVQTDWCITLFLTADSIESQLNLNVNPIGYINNVPVIDLQCLFDALEASAESGNEQHQKYVDLLDDGLNESWSDIVMPYDDFVRQVNISNLPHRIRLKLFKHVIINLAEDCFVERKAASLLIQKYGRQKQTIKENKGFATA